MQIIRTHVRAGWEAVLIRTPVRATVILPVRESRAGARFVPSRAPLAGRPHAPSCGPPRRLMCHRAAPATVRWHATPQQIASQRRGVSQASARGMVTSGGGGASSATAQRAFVGACTWLVCAVECVPNVVTGPRPALRFPCQAKWHRASCIKVTALYSLRWLRGDGNGFQDLGTWHVDNTPYAPRWSTGTLRNGPQPLTSGRRR